jgi:glycosyltransferase involved in cell wall biosynthesis
MHSIIIAAHNSEKTLPQTLDSIKNQTYKDFELIFVDDHSTDKTLTIMQSYSGKKTILKNKEKMGLAYSLNRAIKVSKGEYVFRRDADDLMMDERIEKQARFMDEHPELGVLSSTAICINENGRKIKKIGKGMSSEKTKHALIFGNPIIHPSVVFRNGIKNLRYTENFRYSQDYELWSRLIKNTKFFVMDEPLIQYRINKNKTNAKNQDEKDYFAKKSLQKNIENYAKINEQELYTAMTLAGWTNKFNFKSFLSLSRKLFSNKKLDKVQLLSIITIKLAVFFKSQFT